MNLYDILACPMCKGAVVRHDHTLVCAQCQRAYPILNGIPVLLPEGSTPAPYDHALTVRTSYDPWLPRIVLQSLTADAISLEIGAGNMALSVPNIIRMDITLTPYVDVVGDAHALPFLPNTFSFVFSSAVIEHLRQPFVAAQEMHAILRNGGYVYGECSFVFPYHSHPFHYFNASYKGMEELFQAFTCIRSGVGPHQGPSFAIEALLRTYLYFLEPYNDPDVRPLKDLLQQVLAQPLRQHDLRFSQEAALQCAACIYFFGVKSPHASAVIPAALQSLHAQHPELQQRFADFFDLGIADNILAWAQTADRQRYSELAAYFDAIVPFRKDGTTEDQSPHPLYQEPIVGPPLSSPAIPPPQHGAGLLTATKRLGFATAKQLVRATRHALSQVARRTRTVRSQFSAPSSWPLADITDNGERVTHLYPNDCYFAHLSVYYFAVPFLQGATVLDAGSGTGYGAAYLAEHGARFVYGVDASAKAVAFSRQHFPRPNLQFHTMDLEKIYGFRERQFDVVFCSNVLEHVRQVPAFLRTIWRLLKPEGVLIVAVPPIVNEALRAQNLANPYHLNIWSPRQWAYVLQQYFTEVQAYQHWYDKPGVEINLLNAPADTVMKETDYTFQPIAVDQLYHLPSISGIFTARGPVARPQLPLLGAPLWFMDDSFTRPAPPVHGILRHPLLKRTVQVAREQGLRAAGHKAKAYLARQAAKKSGQV